MVAMRMRKIVAGLAVVGVVGVGLVGCTPTEAATEASGDASMVVVSGTGTYAIGVDIPLGGFQLKGEPDEQPAGCTWAILDADGGVTFENQGQYVFLTDIPEAVTFETSGCPDWEQFE
jgi:hypothetical protein